MEIYIDRYNKRFFTFRWLRYSLQGKDTTSLIPLYDQPVQTLQIKRIKGMTVPSWQAEDFIRLEQFIDVNTSPEETVLTFPEIGSLNYLMDRPFVGRFPLATLSWLNSRWHEEFVAQLKSNPPNILIMSKDPGRSFPYGYFKIPQNKPKYDEVMDFIQAHYRKVDETPTYFIYRNKLVRP